MPNAALVPAPSDAAHRPHPGRDVAADVVRAGALFVVVLWHTTLSMNHRTSAGRLSMPNPIDEIPYGWLLTWVLQVLPAFVLISGAVNGASWARATEGNDRGWNRGRLARLGTGVAVVAAITGIIELGGRLIGAGSFVALNLAVIVPLWTIAVLAAVTPLTGLIERAWRRHGPKVLAGPLAILAVGELLRFQMDVAFGAVLSTAAVWTFAYMLGWVYRHRPDSGLGGLGARWAAGGVAALTVLVALGPYPASMVATRGAAMSNMLPTTAPVAALAMVQLGLLLLTRDRIASYASAPPRKAVVDRLAAAGMAVYLLHMFALVAVMWAVEAVGFTMPSETSTAWWLVRPFWPIAIGIVLVPMVAGAKRVLK